MKKPSLRFRKEGVEEDVFNQGLAQPTSDNNLTVHARMSVNILLLVRLMCSLEVLILVNQPKQDVKDSIFSYSVLFTLLFNNISQTPCANGFS